MEIIGVDETVAERVARVLRNNKPDLPRLNVYDERYYPPSSTDLELALRYFIVLVAMDHRLSRPGRPYQACLEDGCYSGADLLYRLGMRIFHENPDFYSPEHLANISVDEVKKVFSAGDSSPPDPEIRAFLLRDLGYKLLKLFNGSTTVLLKMAGSRVRGSIFEPGLVDLLRVFRAYEDPVEKKSMLLTKFLTARGYFKPIDELDVAVDNHLSRIAYRVGLVAVSGSLWNKIKSGVEVSSEEDILLRLIVRRAYKIVSRKSGLGAGLVDDFFWIMGRTTCFREKPPICDKCLFKGFCRARKNNAFMVSEHVYYNTWYY
jgi:hypothetical protein